MALSSKAQQALQRIKRSTGNLADEAREYAPEDFVNKYQVTLAEGKEMAQEVRKFFYGTKDEAPKFKKGDQVRENRQGAATETVIRVEGTTIFTTKGNLHTSKAVLVKKGNGTLDTKITKDAEIQLPKNVTTVRQGLEFLAEAGEKSQLQTIFKKWEAYSANPSKLKPPSVAERTFLKKIASRNSRMKGALEGTIMQWQNHYN